MLAVGDANYSATSQFSMTPGASPAGYLLLTDIEDRTRALARLEQLQSDFVHMNRVSVMGELVASLSHEITQPIASARNDEKFKRAIASEIPYHFEQRLRRFDGEYRWFETRGGAVRDDTGRIVRWYVLLTDIEDRKRAQEVLRESERSLRLAIDGIDGLVGVLAPNGELQAANRQLFEYFGRSLEELKNWGTNDTEGASAKRAI